MKGRADGALCASWAVLRDLVCTPNFAIHARIPPLPSFLPRRYTNAHTKHPPSATLQTIWPPPSHSYLKGHSVPEETIEDGFRAAKQFFKLPLEEKIKVRRAGFCRLWSRYTPDCQLDCVTPGEGTSSRCCTSVGGQGDRSGNSKEGRISGPTSSLTLRPSFDLTSTAPSWSRSTD